MKLHHHRAAAHVVCPVGSPAFTVDGDADFEVDEDLARSLLEQTDNYGPVDEASTALLAEIRATATSTGDRQAAAQAAVQAAEDALNTARAEQAALSVPDEHAAATSAPRRKKTRPAAAGDDTQDEE